MLKEEWRRHAACLGEDPDLFFPEGTPHSEAWQEQVDEAKSICHDCPVKDKCLQFAIDTEQENGVWGGLCGSEIQTVVRRAKRLRNLGYGRGFRHAG